MSIVDQAKLHDALRQMGKKHVRPPYNKEWTPERPTTGYCYVVAEVVYHYLAPKGSRPYMIRMENDETHWFVKVPSGSIIDLTADQFDEPPNYDNGKPRNFQTQQISARGRLLAKTLGLDV
jgi:hypothetical protein